MAVSDHGLEVLRKAAELYLSNPNELVIRVKDPGGETLLSQILAALGGSSSTTPSITNINVALANTEQSFNLPSNCKGFKLRSRQASRMRIAFLSGETSTNYYSIGLGGGFEDDNFYASQTIYFQSDRGNTDVEIITYT